MIHNFEPVLSNFEIIMSQKKLMFQNFEKVTKELDLIS